MAGIGLELRRIYRGKKIFSEQKMYLYAGLYYGGPLLLGVFLIMFISALTAYAGMERMDRSLLTSIFTYSVVFSLFFSNVFSAILGRFVSDMIYANRFDKIIPAFLGSNLLMLLLGESVYLAVLSFSGLDLSLIVLSLILFAELVVLWNTVSFITTIQEYKTVLLAYIMSIVVTVVIGFLLFFLGIHSIFAMLLTIALGYGAILFTTIRILFKNLPAPKESIASFEFLIWFDKYPKLLLLGFGLYLGAFLHIVSTWFTPVGEQIKTIFYNAPYYDVPAFYAFLTTIVSTVNFAVFIEVDFYEKFKKHYWLYNHQGTIRDIKEANQDMLMVLKNELKYLAWKQVFASMIFTFIGTQVLQVLPLGFTNLMLGYFRILCLAYGVFAIAQSMILILLYFDDVSGAVVCTTVYGILNILFAILNLFIPTSYYGFGFLISNIVLYVMALVRLEYITGKLPYKILGSQPILYVQKRGIFTKFKELLEKGGLDEDYHTKNEA